MPAFVPALIGGAAALGGSIYSANRQSDAARDAAAMSQFQPWATSSPFGGDFRWGQGVTASEATPQQQEWFNALQGRGLGLLGGGDPLSWATNRGMGLGIQDAFSDFTSANQNVPFYQASQFGNRTTGRENQLQGLAQGALSANTGAGALQGAGMGLLNDGTFDRQLGLLRQYAQPFEDRAFNQLNQNLFDTGRMGSSGGALQTEAFARGLGQADIARQLQATDLANQQASLGAGFLGQAQGMNLGQQGFGASLLGQAQGFGQQGFNNMLGINQLGNDRALQRLATAQNLFGFGQGAQSNSLNQGLAALGGQQSLDAQLRQWAGLGLNAGTGQAQAGANAGQFLVGGAQNNVGNFFAGLGGGMLNGVDWSRLFTGGGGGSTPSPNFTGGTGYVPPNMALGGPSSPNYNMRGPMFGAGLGI